MIQQKVAVVSGASAGVGRATAVALGREVYNVALLARGRAGLDGAAADVRAEGRRALAIPPTWPTSRRSRTPRSASKPSWGR